MTPARGGFTGYRFRRLSPEQAVAVADALDAGADPASLAKAYSVSRSTIDRTVERARREVVTEARVDGWRATYAIADEGPVQLTPWMPVDER